MSEKRQTPDDPRQLKLDFEGMDLTDEEKCQIGEASRKVAESRKVKVREHEKQKPVRKKLPENLRLAQLGAGCPSGCLCPMRVGQWQGRTGFESPRAKLGIFSESKEKKMKNFQNNVNFVCKE